MKSYAELKNSIRSELFQKIDYTRDVTDEEILSLIDEVMVTSLEVKNCVLPIRNRLRKEIYYSVRKLDVLQELIDDPEVTEIMINGANSIFIEKHGEVIPYGEGFESMEKLLDIIQQIVSSCNRTVNEASPIVDARLKNGARVNVVLPPVALNGPVVTIRRFPDNPITMERLIELGSLTKEAAKWLSLLVQAKYNIFISGGTGSGKTTFLNALSGFIPKEERIITIEDSAELQLQMIPNLIRLETRNKNVEGCLEITIRDLIRTSLRMRPERIIVGEVRGAEALDMLQAMNTGHDGSMSTGHANSGTDMLSRLETMVLMGAKLPLSAIRQQIASGIDIIIHLGRLRDKSRRVLEILEVDGFEREEIKTHTLYAFEEVSEKGGKTVVGSFKKKGELLHDEKLKAAGLPQEL